MKSYLEVTWLLTSAFLSVSWMISGILIQSKLNAKKRRIAAVSLAFLASMFAEHHAAFFLTGFLFFSFFLFGWRFLAWIESFLIYHVLIHAFSLFEGIASQHGMIYADSNSAIWLAVLLLLAALSIGIEKLLAPVLRRSELMIPVKIFVSGSCTECIGYYDTGNCCMHEGIPVIFLKTPICTEMFIQVTGISGTQLLPAAHATAELEGRSSNVIAAYVHDLQVECLLHRTMR